MTKFQLSLEIFKSKSTAILNYTRKLSSKNQLSKSVIEDIMLLGETNSSQDVLYSCSKYIYENLIKSEDEITLNKVYGLLAKSIDYSSYEDFRKALIRRSLFISESSKINFIKDKIEFEKKATLLFQSLPVLEKGKSQLEVIFNILLSGEDKFFIEEILSISQRLDKGLKLNSPRLTIKKFTNQMSLIIYGIDYKTFKNI